MLSIVVAIFRIMNRISLSILDYTPAGPYTNVLSLANNVIAERALFSILIVFCYLRGLKLLRIPPFTGPVTQSIMDVRIFVFRSLTFYLDTQSQNSTCFLGLVHYHYLFIQYRLLCRFCI